MNAETHHMLKLSQFLYILLVQEARSRAREIMVLWFRTILCYIIKIPKIMSFFSKLLKTTQNNSAIMHIHTIKLT